MFKKHYFSTQNALTTLGLTFTSMLITANQLESDELFDLQLDALLNVKVTVASDFEETLLDSGSTVELITRSQWEDLGAESVMEAISHFPGTMVYPVPWGGSAIAIRGYSSITSVRGIATLLDGIPMNFLRSGSSLYEIRSFLPSSLDRIEMIRGPGSAKYGSDAFHGVLSMSSYESDIDASTLSTQLSSEGLKHVNANHTSVMDEGFTINASVSYADQLSQDIPYSFTIPNSTQTQSSTRANSYDAYTGIFKLDVKHSEDFQTHYGIYFQGHDSVGSISLGQSQSPSFSILLDNDISDGQQDLYALKAGFNTHFKHNLSVEGNVFNWQSDSLLFTDTTLLNNFGFIGLFEDKLSGANLLLKQTSNTWNTQWAAGIDYKDSKIISATQNLTVSSADRTIVTEIVEPQSGFSREVIGISLSAKTTLAGERLLLIYGGRFDKYSDFGNQTTPRFSVIYQPVETSAFKLLYGEAFRAPIGSELFGIGLTIKGDPDLQPEIIETTELQYLYQNDAWSLSATYFQNDWTSGIDSIPSSDPAFTSEYANTGENEANGFELTVRGRTDHLRWDINGSWTTSKTITDTGDVDYVAFPKQIYNLNVGYYFEQSGIDLYLSNRIHRGAKEGPINGIDINQSDLKNYYNTNLTLDWEAHSNVSLQLGIRNMFDRNNFLPSTWNNENGVAILGRYFQFSIKWKL